LKYINIGGGFFGEINPSLRKSMNINNLPTFSDYGEVICKSLRPELFIEPGSSVVANVMWFLSRIHTHKKIGNKNMLVSYAGRHLLSPTNKSLMYPIELYTYSESCFDNTLSEINVVGFTCIESDIIGKVESINKSDSFDFIAISNVGSYSIVMGSDFIMPQPAVYSFGTNELLRVVRNARTTQTILSEFITDIQ
jgi:diaminopimelate decarboxylase